MRHRGRAENSFISGQPALAEFRFELQPSGVPHEALGMKRPVERYQRSPRSYQENVQEWEYPTGSDVRRFKFARPCSPSKGKRWFVCGALAGQRVRVERFDGKLLVSYRHMLYPRN